MSDIIFICDQPPVKSGHGTGALNYHLLEACKKAGETEYLTSDPSEMHSTGLNPGCDFVAVCKLLSDIKSPLTRAKVVVFGTGTFQATFLTARRENVSRWDSGGSGPRTVMQCMTPPDVDLLTQEHKLWGIPFGTTDTALEAIIEKRVLDECNQFISPSQRCADEFMRLKGVNPERMLIAPYGIDLPPEPPPADENGPRIRALYVSQIGPAKGHAYIINAFGAHPEWNLSLVGQGTDHLSGVVPPNVLRLGRIPDLQYEWARCNVYVHPSVSETWGLGVPEAMAHGRPVIVTRSTGSADCVRDGKEGLVIEPRNPAAIAEALQYFADNPGEIARMGANGRERSQEFTWDKFEGKVVEGLKRMSP